MCLPAIFDYERHSCILFVSEPSRLVGNTLCCTYAVFTNNLLLFTILTSSLASVIFLVILHIKVI